MSSLWKHLGFDRNPYFATPIDISATGCDLFVGRANEVRRFINKWDEVDGCLTVIGGNIGTGKTSFLNVCQYLAMSGARQFGLVYDPPRILPASIKVQIDPRADDRALVTKILWASANSIRQVCDELGVEVPPLANDIISWLGTTVAGDSFGSSFGVEAATIGFTVGSNKSSTLREHANLPVESLIAKLTQLSEEVSKISPFRGIAVAVDNVEFVETERLVELLNKYRDTLFSIPHIWWTLIGQRGLFDLIDAEAPRVAQRIKGTETTLDGLSWGDFHLAIAARIDHFKTRKDAVGPLSDELLRVLFDASSGEIRYVFKMADLIVSDALAESPDAHVVTPLEAESILRRTVEDQLARQRLSDREKRVLREIGARGAARPKEYKDFGFQNAPNFLQSALQPLQEKGMITKSTQGNAAVYSLRSSSILALRFGIL